MNYIKIESFFIKKIKKTINYKLNLLKNVKVHLIFHVSLLKSIDFNIFIQKTFHYTTQKKNEFEIENILQKQNQ